jgi:nitrilase
MLGKDLNTAPLGLAALQMCSGDALEVNLRQAESLLRAAAAGGAGLAVLPENFAVFGAGLYAETARALPQILDRLAALASELQLWIVAGTLPAASRPDGMATADGRVRAASYVLAADGSIAGRYDKIHLFDVDVADAQGSYRESATFEAGDAVVLVDTPCGRLGLSVCYDLRFAELYLALARQGADIISVPAAFTRHTGEAHWQALLRARAIENQVYMIGAGQGGRHNAKRETWGHSQIIDPWGRLLAECPDDGPGLALASRSPADQEDVRRRMPVHSHRRL